jgi:hypothetical protein
MNALKLVVLTALFSSPLAAQEPQVEKRSAPAPQGVAGSIASALSPEGFRFSVEGKTVAEFWFRKELPLKDSPRGGLAVSFKKLETGTLVGVVKLSAPWSDYKGQSIPEGVYTLRYGVQPADGNHMGVSFYRDYLLLVAAAEDKELTTDFALEELAPLSFSASRTSHPAVLSLFPVQKEVSGPELSKNEIGQWMVAVKVGSLTLGLVLIGQGEV